jgi:hypothetical protein
MKIEKHISSLLYRYQCVTVPGFGAFLTEIQPAQIDGDANTFYPPKKLISFNANLKNNDGLLANHIAMQEKISYEQAVAAIEKAVDKWYHTLKTDSTESLFLRNIGFLAYNAEGSIVFTPDTPVNYLTDAFGLSTVISPAVKREELKELAEAFEEKAPVVFTPERKKNYSYLKYAAMFATMIFVGGSAGKYLYDKEVAEQTLLVEQAVQEKVQHKIQQATFFIENPLPAVELKIKETTPVILPYHVVAGAFKSEANADRAVEQLATKGFSNAKRLEKNKFGLYPVLYGSFATQEEAQRSMMEIRRSHNSEAWLLIKEL